MVAINSHQLSGKNGFSAITTWFRTTKRVRRNMGVWTWETKEVQLGGRYVVIEGCNQNYSRVNLQNMKLQKMIGTLMTIKILRIYWKGP